MKTRACATLALLMLAVPSSSAWGEHQRWQTPQTISSARTYAGMDAADVDADGRVELLAGFRCEPPGGCYWGPSGIDVFAYDAATHGWVLEQTVFGPTSGDTWNDIHDITSGDIDQDGDVDLVATMRFNGTWVLRNDGAAGWSGTHLDHAYGWHVELRDFDADGRLDLQIDSDYWYARMFRGHGNGLFTPAPAPAPLGGWLATGWLTPVDVDADGRLDLVGHTYEHSVGRLYLRVWRQNVDGTWSSIGPTDEVLVVNTGWPAAADIDGDGLIDYAGVTYDEAWNPADLTVFWGGRDALGGLEWVRRTRLGELRNASVHATVADVDADGRPDVLAVPASGGLQIYYGDGAGGFSVPEALVPEAGDVRMEVTHDVNGDGRPDLLFSKFIGRRLGVILSNTAWADAGPDLSVAAGPGCRALVQLDGTRSFDRDGDVLTFTWSGPFGTLGGATPQIELPLGTYDVTLTVSDGYGSVDSDTLAVSVVDVTAPVFTAGAVPAQLWPPNHRLEQVTVSVAARDECDAAPTCRVVAVTSNEPIDGLGDGDTAPDWIVAGDLAVWLRAERSGRGNGRAYALELSCSDAAGNLSAGTARVTVPKNRS